jgi:hypothetical protein
MNLKLIDNNFFRLTEAQAKELSINGQLPRSGYEIPADPEKLKAVELDWRCAYSGKATQATQAWILRTTIRSWDGEWIGPTSVWALHLYFSVG